MARTRATRRASQQPDPSAANGSSENPIIVDDGASLVENQRNTRIAKQPQMTTASRTLKGSRVKKAAMKPKIPKAKAVKKDCIICVSTRQVGNTPDRGFRGIEGTCEHFQNTCNVCIGKMIKEKIAKRELDEAVLVCAFPNCEHVIDYNIITQMIFKGVRESWDIALLQQLVRNGENYIACLNTQCGHYFSIEDCQGKSAKSGKSERGKEIACPYCEYEMCLTCMHPYHGSGNCNKADEKQSLKAIKAMGAKPCPKCGVNIEKNGGCNHMKCKSCKHDFCFSCLTAYGPKMQHAKGCPEYNLNIMQDPRNWLPDGVNPGGNLNIQAAAAQFGVDPPGGGFLNALMNARLPPPQPAATPPPQAGPPPPQPPPVAAPQQRGNAPAWLNGVLNFVGRFHPTHNGNQAHHHVTVGNVHNLRVLPPPPNNDNGNGNGNGGGDPRNRNGMVGGWMNI